MESCHYYQQSMHACLVAWPRWLGKKKKKHAVIEVGHSRFSSEMMMLWRTQIQIDLLKSQTKQDLRLQYVKLSHCVSTSYSGYTVFSFIKRRCANFFQFNVLYDLLRPNKLHYRRYDETAFVAEITKTKRKSQTVGKYRQCILCFLQLLSEIFRACLSPVTEEFSFRKTPTGLTTNLKDIPL